MPNGAADPLVPADSVRAFEQEMKAAGVDYRLINYEGARHGFTNPAADYYGETYQMPVAYDAEADRRSWQEMSRFLEQSLGRAESR